MDVIGNNIANVNTTSFKSQSITFSDLMYQTTQTASGATATKGGINARQIGLGAKSGAINTAIESQGATQTTNNPFDIMITGKAFFVVNNGNENLYTRDGSFYVDGAGNLAMQSNGYLVQGWKAVEDRDTGEITISKGELTGLQIMSPENSTYSPASTTSSVFSGNIDDFDSNVTSDDGKTITLEFYDNKGYLYTGKFTLKDTETEHLFALTLTDIIDSNGKSINDNPEGIDRLSLITLGDQTNTKARSQTTKVQQGYSAVQSVDSTKITINKDGGDIKYDNVAKHGNLVDLMSSATTNAKTANLLQDAYDLSDDKIKELYGETLFKEAEYDIATNGDITVTFAKPDLSSLPYDANTFQQVDFGTKNTDEYFTNAASQKAYKVPSSQGGKKDATDLTTDFLKDVFNITTDYTATDASGKALYSYTYGSGKLSIYKNIELATTTSGRPIADIYTAGSSTDISQYFGTSSSAADTLHTVIENWASIAGNDLNNLSYTYSASGELTITQKVTSHPSNTGYCDTAFADPLKTNIENLLTKMGKTIGGASPDEITYNEIALAATVGATYPYSTPPFTVQAEEAATAQELLNLMLTNWSTIAPDAESQTTLNQLVSFKIADLSGTKGLIVTYTGTEVAEKGFPDAALSSTTYVARAVEYDKAYVSDYTKTTPSYVYQNRSTYGTSYYVLDNALTRDDVTATNINADFLKAVFAGKSADIQDFINNMGTGTFSMSISKEGYVTFSHKETSGTPHSKLEKYTIDTNEDGTIRYSTSAAYEDVPATGNISDLLETAKGEYAGILKKVYGISDEAADAFGIDGTYSIDNTPGSSNYGAMTLNVGKHSITLEFKPENGVIRAVDGNTDAAMTVDLHFNQTEGYGLEPFGFQASATNADEQERAGNITIDFSTVTNYNTNGSSTIKAVKGDKKSLNTGRAVGEMNGVSVSTDGQIYATYSNGQTKLLGQIASAEFANASGLSKEGDNLYSSTLNSGEATIQDITTDGGYMNTGVLEMSNVDLSSQFTEMITTQRGFQANSRIITVSDTLLEELTNLKR
jgi:flagellar hook protein FlgE